MIHKGGLSEVRLWLAGAVSALVVMASPVFAVSLEKYPQLAELADRLDGTEGLEREQMKEWFREAKIQSKIIDAMNRPAERLSWQRYQSLFVNPASINGGIQFLKQHADILFRAEERFGVPAEIIVAIIGIETRYG